MKICLLIATMLLTGCTSTTVTIANIKESESIVVTDARPPSEKVRKIFSFIISDGAYGTSRRGDDEINPTPVRLLQHRVYERFAGFTSPQVTVYHFVTYCNTQAASRRSAAGAAAGVVGAIIVGNAKRGVVNPTKKVINSASFGDFDGEEEYERAFATERENPANAGVFIVYLDAAINGRRTFIRSVSPVRDKTVSNPHIAAVEDAISFFLDQYRLR